MRKDKVIKQLDKLKEEHPNQEIIVETPEGTVSLKIGDALIYEGCRGEIVIDSEQMITMSLDKAIEHGKEKIKPYYGAQSY